MSESGSGASRGRAFGAILVLVGVVVALGFIARTWRPEAASAHAEGVDRVITFLLVATGIFVVAGHIVLGMFVFKYSGDSGPAPYKPVSRRTEVKWAVGLMLVMALVAEGGVIVLGLPVWAEVYGEEPEGALEIDVVGKQFEWFVRYPGKDGTFGRTRPELVHDVDNPMGLDEDDPASHDDIFVRGAMRLPVDRPVIIRMRSHDVLHSFCVTEFRVKQDLVPGYRTKVQFKPTREGKYEIACAELCGLGHYRMRGLLYVESQEEFDAWMAKQIGWFE